MYFHNKEKEARNLKGQGCVRTWEGLEREKKRAMTNHIIISKKKLSTQIYTY